MGNSIVIVFDITVHENHPSHLFTFDSPLLKRLRRNPQAGMFKKGLTLLLQSTVARHVIFCLFASMIWWVHILSNGRVLFIYLLIVELLVVIFRVQVIITFLVFAFQYALRKLYHESPRLICVLYTAPTCGPCRTLKPILSTVSSVVQFLVVHFYLGKRSLSAL